MRGDSGSLDCDRNHHHHHHHHQLQPPQPSPITQSSPNAFITTGRCDVSALDGHSLKSHSGSVTRTRRTRGKQFGDNSRFMTNSTDYSSMENYQLNGTGSESPYRATKSGNGFQLMDTSSLSMGSDFSDACTASTTPELRSPLGSQIHQDRPQSVCIDLEGTESPHLMSDLNSVTSSIAADDMVRCGTDQLSVTFKPNGTYCSTDSGVGHSTSSDDYSNTITGYAITSLANGCLTELSTTPTTTGSVNTLGVEHHSFSKVTDSNTYLSESLNSGTSSLVTSLTDLYGMPMIDRHNCENTVSLSDETSLSVPPSLDLNLSASFRQLYHALFDSTGVHCESPLFHPSSSSSSSSGDCLTRNSPSIDKVPSVDHRDPDGIFALHRRVSVSGSTVSSKLSTTDPTFPCVNDNSDQSRLSMSALLYRSLRTASLFDWGSVNLDDYTDLTSKIRAASANPRNLTIEQLSDLNSSLEQAFNRIVQSRNDRAQPIFGHRPRSDPLVFHAKRSLDPGTHFDPEQPSHKTLRSNSLNEQPDMRVLDVLKRNGGSLAGDIVDSITRIASPRVDSHQHPHQSVPGQSVTFLADPQSDTGMHCDGSGFSTPYPRPLSAIPTTDTMDSWTVDAIGQYAHETSRCTSSSE
ncbi:unnamed protein product [Echinostoma caproni]|uniref:Suppressor of cytokine signaling at 16d n=1 Tax=Echinostoma caproni TaxID=27848 RepID=A0A183ATB7_9TREM|nr:unnamed protein product [Echinostoma caproni]